jgi:hypothetical protein
MTLIVFALYSMFNQTQRALRSNEAQVDSTERGRGVLELVSREMESVRVGMRADTTNLWLRTALLPIGQNDVPGATPSVVGIPLRSNRFDDVYYLTKGERAWRGVGYVVLASTNLPKGEALDRPVAGLGTLYRYETPLTNRDYTFPSTRLFSGWIDSLPAANKQLWATNGNATNFSQVSQGIVHFRVLPYDTRGQLMSMQTTNIDSTYQMIRTGPLGVMKYPLSNMQGAKGNTNDIGLVNVVLSQATVADPLSTLATFRSNAIPAYLELELGVLEPDALRTYNQMIKDDMGAQAKAYLERRIAKVQIFRKRIPLRTVAQ